MPRDVIGMQVGALAAEFGINPRTIRYYERLGLLRAPARTRTGYRLYSRAERDRLRFILKAKETGLTLAEIRDVLSLRDRGIEPCDRVRTLIESKLEGLDRQVQALLDFRQELDALRREAAAPPATGCICGVIEQHESHHSVESLRLAARVLSQPSVRAGARNSGRSSASRESRRGSAG